MGASVAWHLVRDPAFRGRVTLLERDPGFAQASTALSAGSIRVQFSTPENIRLSQYGWRFLAEAPRLIGVDCGLRRRPYLMLAGAAGAPALRQNVAAQLAEGAEVELLDREALAARFPWLATDGVAAGALGRDEGGFDPPALAAGLRRGATAAGAEMVSAEAAGFDMSGGRVRAVRQADGDALPADVVVDAAGPWAAAVASWAGVALPVEPRKRTVFVVRTRAPEAPRDGPLLVDPAGFWMRPEGDGFLASVTPEDDPPAGDDFAPDWALWEGRLWPLLAARVPAFEAARAETAWAGLYEYNTLDQNALIGRLPQAENLFFVNGFSGHGAQQAPGAGRAVAELIVHGRFVSLDLSVFDVGRIATGRRVVERNVI